MKGKVIYTRVKFDFCGYVVHVWKCADPYKFRNEDLIRSYPKLHKYNHDFHALHSTGKDYPGESFIIVPLKCSAGVLAHEIVHAVDRMMKYHGLKGTEMRAYGVEYVLNKVI